MRRMNADIDIRHILPTISVPTLVIYRSDEYFWEATRYMGERIPGARMVELPGNDHLPWEGDQEAVLDAIAAFLADDRNAEATPCSPPCSSPRPSSRRRRTAGRGPTSSPCTSA